MKRVCQIAKNKVSKGLFGDGIAKTDQSRIVREQNASVFDLVSVKAAPMATSPEGLE